MRIPGRTTLRRVLRWTRSRLHGGVAILGYHRVANVDWDPFGLAVTPDAFAEQLEAIRTYAVPMRLEDVVRGLRRNQLPRRAVVLTFDDGYLDNLVDLEPLLRGAQVPATVFVTTGGLGAPFWWDELTALMHPRHEIPDDLRLGSKVFELGDRNASDPNVRSRERQRLVQAIQGWILGQPLDQRRALLDTLRRWSGKPGVPEPEVRAVTPDELRTLAASELIDIGAHTENHPPLATLRGVALEREIMASRSRLEELTGGRIDSFSYPHGSTSVEAREVLRRGGFAVACCGTQELAGSHHDPLLLPRLWPPDAGAERFSPWIRRWIFGL